MKKTKAEIKIRIDKIQEMEFSCKDIPKDFGVVEFGKDLTFAIGFSYLPDIEKKIFFLTTNIKYVLTNTNEEVLHFVNEIQFEVIGLEKIVKKGDKNGEYIINDNFLSTLLSVSIGTTRGMLSVITRGKKINNYPLPILNPKEVLDQIKVKTTLTS